MFYFNQQIDRSHINYCLVNLERISNRLFTFERKIIAERNYLENTNGFYKIKSESQKWLDRVPKNKARYEKLFQKELAKLVDLNYIAKTFTSELLDEISEIDPDSICEEAIKIETRSV